jgi:methyltransferase-like protein/ubiquinone/menaquinone biosynthesis C-methylase UbiE
MDPYDALPYESIAFPETHPSHLAVLGRLFGLPTADPEGCRVLELGCASGGNLIPMAWHLPRARFVGIDLSGTQVEEGKRLIERLGLTNIELRQGDILALDEGLGEYDYIVAHGVYSWVPAPVREHLLRLAPHLLAPDGLCYLSYNTLPGWRMRGMLRDILLYACRDADTPQARLAAAQAALERLQSALHRLDALSARYLMEEIKHLRGAHPSYLLFEYLAEHNQAFLFSDFFADAEAGGLRYLCDTDLRTVFASTYGEEVERALEPIEDGVELEQWLDFVTNRNFRQSVLCRSDTTLDDDIAIDLDRFATLAFRCDLRAVKRPDLRREKDTPFATPSGVRLQVSHPLTKALLGLLAARFPDSVPLEELMPAAVQAVGAAGGGALANQVDACLAELFSLFAHRGLAVQPAPHQVPRPDLDHPRLSALARTQVERGDTRVTTLHHGNLDLDSFSARLLTWLDGTRTPEELVRQMAADLESGALEPPGEARPRQWPRERLLTHVRTAVQELLALLARHGLLEPPRGEA